MPSDDSTIKTEGTTDGKSVDTKNGTDSQSSNSGRRWKHVLPIRAPQFEGRCSELLGHVYDCSDARQADRFTKTTKELAEHVGREYRYGNNLRLAITDMKDITVVPPNDPDSSASKMDIRVWEKRVDEYVKRTNYYNENKKTLYSLIWGQCTDIMRTKLEALKGFKSMSSAADSLLLLKSVKGIVFNFQEQTYRVHSIHAAKRKFYSMTQERNMSCQDYLEHFQNCVDVIEHCGGTMGEDEGTIVDILAESALTRTSADSAQLLDATIKAKERYLRYVFICAADRSRYGKLMEDLENSYVQGHDKYPKAMTSAFNLLIYWRYTPVPAQGIGTRGNDGLAFATTDEGRKGTSKKKPEPPIEEIQCYRCKCMGHYAGDCPEGLKGGEGKTVEGKTMLMAGLESDDLDTFHFHQHAEHRTSVPENWILLDNQSTVDTFSNPRLLTNIRQADVTMNVHCNAGISTTRMVGDLPGYGTVWYDAKGIANILSFAKVCARYRVTYDESADEFIVHKKGGSHHFRSSKEGLYYLNSGVGSDMSMLFITTVKGNMEQYTKRQVKQAQLARKIGNITGLASKAMMDRIINRNLLPNFPVSQMDIMAAENIFGPSLSGIKGRSIRHSTDHVVTDTIPIPHQLLDVHKNVTLCGDIMFVNRNAFLVTVSRNIKFGTVEGLADKTSEAIMKSLAKVTSLYQKRGFCVETLLMDGEFRNLRPLVHERLQAEMNVVSRGEHVPEVERYIRTVKERVRGTYGILPFTSIPTRMIIELVYNSVFWLNAFPFEDGISSTLSPRVLVTGKPVDCAKHCRIEFGRYAQIHEEHDNSMTSRTTGAIALGPTGNSQGSYFFLSLVSGRSVNRGHWTELPITEDVIQRVNAMGSRFREGNDVIFGLRDGTPMTDVEEAVPIVPDDDSAVPELIVPEVDFGPPLVIDVQDQEENVEVVGVENAHIYNAEIAGVENAIAGVENAHIDVAPPAEVNAEHGHPYNLRARNAQGQVEVDDEMAHDMARHVEEQYGDQGHGYNLRPRAPRHNEHLHCNIMETVLTQYSIKKGLKFFGNEAADAVMAEMRQLHDRGAIIPQSADELTLDQRKASLEYLMFLKQKRDGRLKGRGCADGRKQRAHTSKEEVSSPTVAVESVMLSCIIDSKERRDVAIADIPGAFLHADIDEDIIMKLRGTMAELMVQVSPEFYRKYIVDHDGKAVLYVKLRKALYGTLKAALLFWKKLTTDLMAWGFVFNPYDQCVMNKDINVSQCTILWHVDDLKVSHMDAQVVTDVLALLEKEYGDASPLSITRGKHHDYLGMHLDFSQDGKVKISMTQYIMDMLNDLPAEMNGEATTPAANHLFTVNPDGCGLDEHGAQLFHHNVAKLLFLCKRARPDIQTAVSFLSTRVQSPDTDDLKKLGRVMKYLRRTSNMVLTLEADDLHILKWWADGAFAVHDDMKSHSGGALTLGKGVTFGMSIKQKINTKSSTEAEVVAVNDVLSQVLWTNYFLREQGYLVNNTIVYQDNLSAMLLERNGKASSGKRTRHMNIRYFYIKDHVDHGDIELQYCPTETMVADFFTKPLQGKLFNQFVTLIMNLD